MPILPLDHPEPFAATLGVMLYPSVDDADQRKAKAFAAHYLAEPIRRLHESGGVLSVEDLTRIATDGGARLDDLDQRWWDGTATGEMLKSHFILANTNPNLASWNSAVKIAEQVAARSKVSGSRSALMEAKSKFLTVAHLWGAWSIRGGRFSAEPEVGYDGIADFHSFLTEAEILRRWGQSWRPSRAKAEPPLPKNVWRVPDDWSPLERQSDWPDTGKVPDLTLPDKLIAGLKPAGRPKKSD